MKINTTDGSIAFPSGTIRPSHDRDAFAASMVDATPREVFTNEDWRHFDVDPEPGIKLTVFFKGHRMDRVFVLMSIPSDKASEWTEQLELARKAKHDSWLRAEIGDPPYDYRWGSVTSDYDPRGCVSEIIITYAS
ncbi:MAG: hypothetical protein WD051_00195 [Steroidobacteraceae bacterium]